MNRRTAVFALVACCALFASGCDSLAEKAGVDQVEVSPGFAASVPVVPNRSTLRSGTVNRGGEALPNVFDVESITIAPEDVTFTDAPGKTTAPRADGTITFILVVDGIPAATTSVTIQNDAVTGIDPSVAAITAVSETIVSTALAALPEDERPELQTGLSASEVRSRVEQALRSTGFDAAIIVYNPSDVAGVISFRKLTFNLGF